MARTAPRSYLVAGHVCVDVLPGRADRIGGTVFFSSGQAAAMGCRTTVVTACTATTGQWAAAQLQPGVELERRPSGTDTCFEFGIDAEAGPQRLASRAESLDHLGPAGAAADVVHLAPVFAELTPDLVAEARRAPFVGATPQGFLRGVDGDGRLVLVADGWPAAPDFADAVVLNDDEYRHLVAVGLLDGFAGLVFRTAGPRGAAVLHRGVVLARHEPGPGPEAAPQHTIGAGDVFAAAAFVALAGGATPDAAVAVAVESATAYVRRPSDTPTFVDGADSGAPTAG